MFKFNKAEVLVLDNPLNTTTPMLKYRWYTYNKKELERKKFSSVACLGYIGDVICQSLYNDSQHNFDLIFGIKDNIIMALFTSTPVKQEVVDHVNNTIKLWGLEKKVILNKIDNKNYYLQFKGVTLLYDKWRIQGLVHVFRILYYNDNISFKIINDVKIYNCGAYRESLSRLLTLSEIPISQQDMKNLRFINLNHKIYDPVEFGTNMILFSHDCGVLHLTTHILNHLKIPYETANTK